MVAYRNFYGSIKKSFTFEALTLIVCTPCMRSCTPKALEYGLHLKFLAEQLLAGCFGCMLFSFAILQEVVNCKGLIKWLNLLHIVQQE